MELKNVVLAAVAVLLAACGGAKLHDTTQRARPPAVEKPPVGPGMWVIDPTLSELRVLVYRSGAMARLGHNHVIVNRALGGWLKYNGLASAASFALRVPVADFTVDDAGVREQEGADFSDEIGDQAKQGTARNLLSAGLLDVEHYPAITLSSVAVTQNAAGLTATMALHIAGHDSTLSVPFQAVVSTGQVVASGSVRLRQTSMGLTPFSVMLGALQVQDELTIKFTLVATSI